MHTSQTFHEYFQRNNITSLQFAYGNVVEFEERISLLEVYVLKYMAVIHDLHKNSINMLYIHVISTMFQFVCLRY